MYVNFNFNRKIKYILYFVIGFLLAITISNAKAFELDEQHIYDSFKSAYPNFDIKNAPKILCQTSSGSSTYSCYAMNDNYIDNMTTINDTYFVSFALYPDNIPDVDNVYFYYLSLSESSYSAAWYSIENGKLQRFPNMDVMRLSKFNSSSWFSYTNFDTRKYGLNSSQNAKNQVLDFGFLDPTLLSINVYDKDNKLINAKICKKSAFDDGQFCGLTFDNKNSSYLNANYHIENYSDNYSVKSNIYNNLNFDIINGLNEDEIYSIKFGYYDENNQYQEYSPTKFYLEKTFNNELVNYNINFLSEQEITSVSNIIITFKFKNRLINSMYFKDGITLVSNETFDESNASETILNNSLNNLNSSINNSNVDGASNSAGGFFNNFEDDDYGLSDIITIPLNLIKSCTSSTCTALNLQVPFVENKTLTLPCMRNIYEEYFGSFLTLYQTITFGIVAYWVCVNIYATVKGFKDPDNDKIEVMDL